MDFDILIKNEAKYTIISANNDLFWHLCYVKRYDGIEFNYRIDKDVHIIENDYVQIQSSDNVTVKTVINIKKAKEKGMTLNVDLKCMKDIIEATGYAEIDESEYYNVNIDKVCDYIKKYGELHKQIENTSLKVDMDISITENTIKILRKSKYSEEERKQKNEDILKKYREDENERFYSLELSYENEKLDFPAHIDNYIDVVTKLSKIEDNLKIDMVEINIPGHCVDIPCIEIKTPKFVLYFEGSIFLSLHIYDEELLNNSYFITSKGNKHNFGKVRQENYVEGFGYKGFAGSKYGAGDIRHTISSMHALYDLEYSV